MRELKTHFSVPDFLNRSRPTRLCLTKATVARLSTKREQVTCNICKHMIREYGDKHVIERGDVFGWNL